MKGNIDMDCNSIHNVGSLTFCIPPGGPQDVLDMKLNNIRRGNIFEAKAVKCRGITSGEANVPVTIGDNLNLWDGANKTHLTCENANVWGDLRLGTASSRIENISNANNPILCRNDVAIRTASGSDALFCKKVYSSDRSLETGAVNTGINLFDVNSVSAVGDNIDFQGNLIQPGPDPGHCELYAAKRTRSDVTAHPDKLVSYDNIKSFFSAPDENFKQRFHSTRFALPSKRICDISQFVNLPFKHIEVTINDEFKGSPDTTPIDLRLKTPIGIYCVGVGKQAETDPNPGDYRQVKSQNPTVTPFTFQQFVCPFGIFANPGSCSFRYGEKELEQIDTEVRCKPYMNYQDAKKIDPYPGIYANAELFDSFYDYKGAAENWRSVCRYYAFKELKFEGAEVVLPQGWSRAFESYWDNMPASKDEGSMPGVGYAHAFPTVSYNYNGDGQGYDANGNAGNLEDPKSFVPSTYPRSVRFCLILLNKDKDPKHNFDDVTFHDGPVVWVYDQPDRTVHRWEKADITIPANTYYGVGLVAFGGWNNRRCPMFALPSTDKLIPENLNGRTKGGDDDDAPYYWRSPYSLISLSSTKFGPHANRVNNHAVSADGPIWLPYLPPFVHAGNVEIPKPRFIEPFNVDIHTFADYQLPDSSDNFLGICSMFDYWLSNPGKTWSGANLTPQHFDIRWIDFSRDAYRLLRNHNPNGKAGLLPESIAFEVSET